MIVFCLTHFVAENMTLNVKKRPQFYPFEMKELDFLSDRGVPQYKGQDIELRCNVQYSVEACKYDGEYFLCEGRLIDE